MQIKKRYPYKTSILIISLIMMSISVYSQESANTSLIATFQQYQSDHYQEKVFIHTDKNFYLAGETIWMKAYVTDGFFHALSTLSKVVYIEILDKNQNPVLRTKMAVSDATGEASLSIPATVLSGNYILRGYTQWMKNFLSAGQSVLQKSQNSNHIMQMPGLAGDSYWANRAVSMKTSSS